MMGDENPEWSVGHAYVVGDGVKSSCLPRTSAACKSGVVS